MMSPISPNRFLESLKGGGRLARGTPEHVGRPGHRPAGRGPADVDGSRYFQDLSQRNPSDVTAQTLAGFFQVRAGHDLAAAISKLDKTATMDVGLPQYFRGIALAELLPPRRACPRPSWRRWTVNGRTRSSPTSSWCWRSATSSRPCCFAPRTRASPVPMRRSGGSSRRPRHGDGQVSVRPRQTGSRCSRASR